MRNSRCLNLFVAAVFLAGAMTSSAGNLIIDVAFTSAAVTSKTGFAATGDTPFDFWNTCTVVINGGGFAAALPLELVSRTASGAGLTIADASGFYSRSGVVSNGASDPMYGTYLYSLQWMYLTVTNLSAGSYNFYIYGHGGTDNENAVFGLAVGAQSYPSQQTIAGPGWLSSVWQEGVQYVEWTNVNVATGQPVLMTVAPGSVGDTVLSGLQIAPTPVPFVANQPMNETVTPGSTTSFSVVAGGSAPLAYQWLFDNSNIQDATNTTYVVTNIQSPELGGYSVIITNSYGSVTSTVAGLNLIATRTSKVIDVDFTGASVTSEVGFAATGVTTNDFWNTYNPSSGTLSNLKFMDGTASGAGLTVANIQSAYEDGASDPMYADYLYNQFGNMTVTVTNLIAGAYNFYVYGHGDGPTEYSLYNFAVGSQDYGSQATVSGPEWLSPVWQEGVQYVEFTNVNVPAGQTITITVQSGESTGGTIYAVLGGLQIASTPGPFLLSQPTDQAIFPGAMAIFSVEAGGAPPLSYQWLFDNANVSQATNSSYSLTNAQPSNAGSYSVIVTNAFGSATSTVAVLNVIAPATNVIDVAFTSASITSKTGFAATGETAYDFWNTCTTDGAANLKFADGALSGAGLTIGGVEAPYENGAADPMFGTYFYTEVPNFSSGIIVTITNLSADLYDFYIYGHGNEDDENSVFQVAVGSRSYGSQATDGGDAAWLSPLWQEGIQYVEFTNVSVLAGQVVTITASPGASPYSFISGMQMVPFVLPTNGSPLIINTPNQFVNATEGVIVTNYAFSTNEPISFTLASNAPAGAAITKDGVFYWAPTCEQGSTTNLITVWATDSSTPPLSNSMTFSVIVGECVQVSIGSSVVQAGQSTCVPVNLLSTVGLTNLSFSLAYPNGFLTNWNITPSNSAVAFAGAITIDASHTQFSFGVQSGQVLQGTTLLGSICLDTLPGASAFVPLAVANMAATDSNNSPVTNFIGQMGRVVVIGPESLLEASLGTNSSRTLTLYGNPGVSYNVLSATNLTGGHSWINMGSVTLTDLFQTISLGRATNQAQFFKAVQP